MKKIFTSFLLMFTILFLGACHGKAAMDAYIMPESFDNTREYNISFWAKNDSNPTQIQIFENTIEEFESIYPNINVTIRHFISYPDLYKNILQNIATDTTPNVAVAYPDHVASYLERPNMVVDLNTIIDNERYGLAGSELKFDGPSKDEFIEQYLNELYLMDNGKKILSSLPFVRSTECLYVNKTWLIEHGYDIPKNNIFSWDYIWEICRAAKQEDSTMTPFIYQSSDNFFIELCYQNGFDYTSATGEVLFSNDNNKQMVNELYDLYKDGLFDLKANTGIYPGDRFNKLRCIFAVDSSAGATWIGPNSPLGAEGVEDFEVLVTTIPQVNVDNPMVISQGPSLCLFNKSDSQEVLASWLFLQFLTTNKIQVDYCKTEGYCPVTTKANNSLEFINFLNSDEIYSVQKDAIKTLMQYKDNTFTAPAFVGSAIVRDEVGELINKVCKSKKNKPNIDEVFYQAIVDCGFIN